MNLHVVFTVVLLETCSHSIITTPLFGVSVNNWWSSFVVSSKQFQ